MTGKPISLGGSEGRNEATARGCIFTVVEAAHHLGMDLSQAKVAVQGFGNAGSIAAQLVAAEGATVVAVSDSSGGIHDPAGLDIERVIAWKKEHGTVVGFPGATAISNAELLEVECDILIPAALENQITAANAEQRQGPHRGRGGQRPDHARGRRHPPPSAASSSSPTSCATRAA